MRTIRFCCFLTACLALGSVTGLSQITITRDGFLTSMSVGKTGTGYTTVPTSKVQVSVGSASSTAQVWDFRTFTFQKQSDGELIQPATAPHAGDFPAANLVYRLTMPGQAVTMYQYQQVTQNEYLLHGLGYSDATPLYRYTPPAVQMKFPCTRGTTWVYQADPTSPVPNVTIQTSYTWTCDAFGTLRLPSGDYPALRLLTETITKSTTPVGSSLLRSYRYNFVTSSMTGATVTFDSTDAGKSTVSGVIGYVVTGPATAIENQVGAARECLLGTPYPQPADGRIHIPVTLRSASHVRVTLHDALGRLITRIADLEAGAGTTILHCDAATLAAGIYVLHVQTGSMVHRTCIMRR
ncbi:MAG: T9SS type A sorting domain-containing protein [Ignavibacteriae bacterium]|nr:T9SS type A sorting domain-containing protein [Ignavibacteriota bacterium]